MESFLANWGYTALILLGFLEAACIPISSEITFGFAGVLAYQGHLNLVWVIILGTLAELAGSYASYGVGRIGGRPLVHKLGRYVLVTESDVSRAERFLEGRGMWAIPVGRMLPFVRAFISIVAGLVRVPAGKFGILSLIGTILYATAVASLGYALGSTWQSVSHGLAVVGYVLFALVLLAVVGFVAYRLRAFRREAQLKRAPAPASTAPAGIGQSDAPGAGVGHPDATGIGAGRSDAPGAGVGRSDAPGAGVGQPDAPGTGQSGASGAGDRPRPHSHRAG